VIAAQFLGTEGPFWGKPKTPDGRPGVGRGLLVPFPKSNYGHKAIAGLRMRGIRRVIPVLMILPTEPGARPVHGLGQYDAANQGDSEAGHLLPADSPDLGP